MITFHVKYLFVVLVLFLFSEAAVLDDGLNTPDSSPARRYASPIGPTQTATATFPRLFEDLAERSNDAGEAKPTQHVHYQVASPRDYTPPRPSRKFSPPPKHDDGPSYSDDPDDFPSQDDPSWDDGDDDSSGDKNVRRRAAPLRHHTPRRAVPTGQTYPRRAEDSPRKAFPSQKYSPPPKHDDSPPSPDDPNDDPSQDGPSGDDGDDDSSDDVKVRRRATPPRQHTPREAATGKRYRRADSPHRPVPSPKYSPPKHDDQPSSGYPDDIPWQSGQDGDGGDDGDDGDDQSPEDGSSDSSAKRKRSMQEQMAISVGAGFCPAGLSACPIQSTLGLFKDAANEEYECVDFKSDLDNCGGCSSLDPGR